MELATCFLALLHIHVCIYVYKYAYALICMHTQYIQRINNITCIITCNQNMICMYVLARVSNLRLFASFLQLLPIPLHFGLAKTSQRPTTHLLLGSNGPKIYSKTKSSCHALVQMVICLQDTHGQQSCHLPFWISFSDACFKHLGLSLRQRKSSLVRNSCSCSSHPWSMHRRHLLPAIHGWIEAFLKVVVQKP